MPLFGSMMCEFENVVGSVLKSVMIELPSVSRPSPVRNGLLIKSKTPIDIFTQGDNLLMKMNVAFETRSWHMF